jgi:membrane-bound lytic murein transglycosylase B
LATTRITLALALGIVLSLPAVLPAQDPVPTPAAPAQSFEDFLAGVRKDALALGIRPATLDAALTGLEPNPVVVARDRAQPELTQSLDDYLKARLTPTRIQNARTLVQTHAELLGRVEKAYGVPAPMMVAFWGLESNFGQFTGTYQTITSLATLAYDGRRAIFRDELMAALKIVDAGKASPAELKGSWAGAMGQPQFMPSSYLRHAVDFDGDGRIDIWTELPDVFGSMANYLKNSGWQAGERWGREVAITKAVLAKIDRSVAMRTKGCRAVKELTVARPLSEWAKFGVKLADGSALPNGPTPASLVRGLTRYFLVYRNYEAILAYNCSNSYGVSVGLLADTVTAGHTSQGKGPR